MLGEAKNTCSEFEFSQAIGRTIKKDYVQVITAWEFIKGEPQNLFIRRNSSVLHLMTFAAFSGFTVLNL